MNKPKAKITLSDSKHSATRLTSLNAWYAISFMILLHYLDIEWGHKGICDSIAMLTFMHYAFLHYAFLHFVRFCSIRWFIQYSIIQYTQLPKCMFALSLRYNLYHFRLSFAVITQCYMINVLRKKLLCCKKSLRKYPEIRRDIIPFH